MLDKKKFYIYGEWVSPKNPNDLKVIDPSTEEECAVISLGGIEDVNDANEIFDTLMGDLTDGRKHFIQENSLKVANLDT